MRSYVISVLGSLALACALSAQSPVVVPAVTPVPAAKPAQATSDSNANANADLLKLLQEMKAENAETLRKQEAALQQLEEIEKLADQIRINTRRS
jgi:hypothetical protein